ncbi:uncharacterized protein LOC133297147 [Gastrolobium bilobum]|uniref:uncharacterized protein LOC133288849 n=1 Tax=Gastrolobium bilobum TaxID=150636 RepID=UPI002AB12CA7|nr:uncharacterized protein LOC133288849 [Gastrolobium bilobum]XP_061352213.1 uncharacterized protein LOC133297147 [Gastrolobium bilobum]
MCDQASGFNGEQSPPKGYINLKLILGTKDSFRAGRVHFVVVDAISSYNVILGRPTIHEWDMLVSTKHEELNIVGSKNKVVTIKGDQREARECCYETLRIGQGGPNSPPRIRESERTSVNTELVHPCGNQINMVEQDMREELQTPRTELEGELEQVIVEGSDKQCTKIGKTMEAEIKKKLISFLKENCDVFGWKAAEIPGIYPSFCCHKLSMYPGSKPVAQNKRKIGPYQRQAQKEHVDKLLEAGFIRKIQYTIWLSNVVMVKKLSGK